MPLLLLISRTIETKHAHRKSQALSFFEQASPVSGPRPRRFTFQTCFRVDRGRGRTAAQHHVRPVRHIKAARSPTFLQRFPPTSSETYYGGLDGSITSSVAYVFPALIFSLLPGRCGGGSRPHTSASGNVGRNESNEEPRVPRLFPSGRLFLGGGRNKILQSFHSGLFQILSLLIFHV